MEKHNPIGVFDSGIGGLTVAAAIGRELPNEQILYFGDTARCPYGDREPAEVQEFSVQVLDFLYEQGVKMLVVACNTATAVALPRLEQRYDVPVLGVIGPGARAATRQRGHGKIGVIGTAVTIQSGAYARAVRGIDQHADVHSLACPTFVPLVEQGLWTGEEVEQAVHETLRPLMKESIDTLILGCTHYPLLQQTIQRVMGDGVALISSAEETAREVKQVLAFQEQLNPQPRTARDRYYTSGDGSKLRTALEEWFHLTPGLADVISVDMSTRADTTMRTGIR